MYLLVMSLFLIVPLHIFKCYSRLTVANYNIWFLDGETITFLTNMWPGLRKPGISAQITHAQEKAHFLVPMYDKKLLQASFNSLWMFE